VSEHPLIRAYEARRCHVCQGRPAPFGFGPPMTRSGAELWACAAHRAAVEEMLASGRADLTPEPPEQLSLL
jgi:hypothetical protein